jgi:glycosyltransferase involved in cell wall biosynthesis
VPTCPEQPAPARGADTGGARISAIVPVYNGAGVLPQSLPPLIEMRRAGEIAELIVVDDGSTDATVAVAKALGVVPIPSGGRVGPGGARNVAAALAVGEILWFVDADVVVHADAARLIASAFATSGAAAVFGCYDERPPAQNFLSQYKNLVHRYYHDREPGDAATFWAGCGAMRKDAFLACGGFDAARYPHPSIEDIELGFRLRQRGCTIVLDPRIQGRHLKVWRLATLLHTDVVRRALPWSRLIVERSGLPDALNVGSGERVNALLAAALLASLVLAAARALPFWAPLAAIVAVAIANRRLFAAFRSARGTPFAIAAVAFHQVYYVYSGAAFAWCWLGRRINAT